jgi:hypothetical protein
MGSLSRSNSLAGSQSSLSSCSEDADLATTVVKDLNALNAKGSPQIVAVQDGELEDVQKWASALSARFPIVLQERNELSRKYQMFATPFAFLLDEQGKIASKGIIHDAQQIGFVLTGTGQQMDAEEKETEAMRSHLIKDHDVAPEFVKDASSADLSIKHDHIHMVSEPARQRPGE